MKVVENITKKVDYNLSNYNKKLAKKEINNIKK